MNKKLSSVGKVFALSCLYVSVMNAAVAAEDVAPAQLDEVVVSGSRTAEKLAKTPMAVGKVGNKELLRDKPKTIGEAINRVAGVSWNDLGNEQHSMGIRQPNSTNAVYQYLEDGVPIRPLGVFNHNSLNEMNLAGSESVEVVKGAASSLYGSNAVGGAVNFMTARPSATPTAKVGVRHDNVAGFSRIDTGASNTWGDLGVRVSHYSSRRTTNNWQEYSRGAKDSFTLRGDYLLSDSQVLRSTLSYSNLDSAMTGGLTENDYRTRPGYSVNTFTYRKDKTARANLAWEGQTTANGVTTVTLFTRKNDHGQLPSYTINSCVGVNCKGTINNNAITSFGVDAKHNQEFDWLAARFVAGVYVDQTNNTYVSDNLKITRDVASGRYVSYAMNSTAAPLGRRDYKTAITNTALFGQFEVSPVDAVRVVLGGRSDSINYNYQNNLTPGVNFGAANESRSFSHFSPKLGATYALAAKTSVYTNLSQGFVPPEVSQLYGTNNVPNLRPATYDNIELGLRSSFLDGALKLDTAVYQLSGTDTIVGYTISPGVTENRNAGKTRSKGVEFALSYEAGEFDGRFGTTIASHRFDQYSASTTLNYSGKAMPQAPNSLTNLEVGYKPVAGARVALAVVKQGSYWMNNANTVSYAGHTLLNASGSYAFTSSWEGWLQGRNLTNKLYSDSSSSSYSGVGVYTPNVQNSYTPGAPRSVMVGVTYNFEAAK